MMKRLRLTLSLALVLLIFINCIGFAVAAVESNTAYRMAPLTERLGSINNDLIEAELGRFNDMKDHWARDHVGKLTYLEVISGYTDNTFRPENNIQVDEFIKLVVTAMGYTPGNGDTYWAQTFIDIAIEEGLIDSKEYSSYARPINRQEMAKIIANATMKKEFEPNSNYLGVLRSRIKDYPRVSDTHKQSVLVAYGLGLITGYPDYEYKPFNNATRAEASVVVMRFIDPSIRQPVEVNVEKETITLRNNMTGEQETVYPPTLNPEAITVAQALKDSFAKSKGYPGIFLSGLSNSIVTYFFEDEKYASSDDPKYMQMAIIIKTVDDEIEQMNPYNFSIFRPEGVKQQHNEVMQAFLSAIFPIETERIIAEYEKYLNATLTSDSAINQVLIIEDRSVSFFKMPNKQQIDVYISAKGVRYKD